MATQDRKEILKQLDQLIEKNNTPKKSELLKEFAKHYYAHVGTDDLRDRDIENSYGALVSHWNLMAARKTDEAQVNIYNPNIEEHGWSSSHTVIEIVTQDKPFLIDSLRMELNRQGFIMYLMIYLGGIAVVRDDKNKIVKIGDDATEKNSEKEAPIYIEFDRHTDKAVLEKLRKDILRILSDVDFAVKDWPNMLGIAKDVVEDIENRKSNYKLGETEVAETISFLHWLIDDHFIFLGVREYDVTTEEGKEGFRYLPKKALGVLRNTQPKVKFRAFDDMSKPIHDIVSSSRILTVAKANTYATVHRYVYSDLISIKKFNDEGDLVGEVRFIGLFTSMAYNSSPQLIPFIRNKVRIVMNKSKLPVGSHAYKALLNIIEQFPRDDLFQAGIDELFELVMGILHMQERQCIRLFTRKDTFNRFISCMVYIPREQFNTELCQSMQDVLQESFQSPDVSFTTLLSESMLARIHFMVRINPKHTGKHDNKAIEKKLVKIGLSWQKEFVDELLAYFGEERGNEQAVLYKKAFSPSYRDDFLPKAAIYDVKRINDLSDDSPLQMSLYESVDKDETTLRFKLFREKHIIPLSDVLPILENMGLRVISEESYDIKRSDGRLIWLNNFIMKPNDNVEFVLENVRELFQDAFYNTWYGFAEDDGFNHLVLAGQLNWREITVLRAYAKYLRQLCFTFSQPYIETTLKRYPHLANKLIVLFHLYFNPDQKKGPPKTRIKKLEKQFNDDLEKVVSRDDDRILRRYLELMQATVRTNFYRIDKNGNPMSFLSLKVASEKLEGIPSPKPLFEIFVYSPRFEGIHLRGAKVARGGLRWSDRKEDFRTEVLGLMKAQQVKNAVIVPLGAKGGFVAKKINDDDDREVIMEEVIQCYQGFIRSLLGITDNLKDGKIIPPDRVIRYDEDDPYLVVAADKGTSTFSDIANNIAIEYDFWLGDAFASGGSVGYDHKKIGITARGGWESVKRHFRELELDISKTDFTVVGIGDMAGDVFGNGMLLSKHIKLVAAFNHLHIFIDPNPSAEISFNERKRLFEMPRSSWEDYNPELISPGGGVFSRSAKIIKISPEARHLLKLKTDFVEPIQLIQAILMAEVDLFWNGGIGTYVKATDETNAEVGDRSNDALRIDATQLHCRVVGEGGNLGLTQKARIEFALNGGFINTDFIDNSAGVDCSDHEVNIKILLNAAMQDGEITEKQRVKLMAQMTDEVAELVLRNNYLQNQSLTNAMFHPSATVDLYHRYISDLERSGKIDRGLEYLPNKKNLSERQAAESGFTRPELSVIMSYSKNLVKQELLNSDLPDDPEFLYVLQYAFPQVLSKKYIKQMNSHRLRREIIATHLSNKLINRMGATCAHRLYNETGATVSQIVSAFVIACKIYDAQTVWKQIEDLDSIVHVKVQVQMYIEFYRLIQRSTRWLLRNRRSQLKLEKLTDFFKDGVEELVSHIPEWLMGDSLDNLKGHTQEYRDQGVPKKLATRMASVKTLFSALDIIEASKKSGYSISDLGKMYFMLGERLHLSWFREKLHEQSVMNRWESLQRSILLDDLERQQRGLMVSAMRMNKGRDLSLDALLELWIECYQDLANRWLDIVGDMRAASNRSFTMFAVAVRELMDLAQFGLLHPKADIKLLESKKNSAKE